MNELPLLPTTGVGSFPKPDYVRKSPQGRLDDDTRRATREFIEQQSVMGIDVLVDGEFYRGDMATDYYRALGLPLADWTRSYGDTVWRCWKKGIVDRELNPGEPIQTEQFRYAQGLTSRPVKGMLTGPTTLANWGFNNHYRSREDLVLAWARVVNAEAKRLEAAGAKYIQIDEPAIGERKENALFKEGLRVARDGVKAYTITHVCYSEFPAVYDEMKDSPIDQVDIEMAEQLDLGLERSTLLQRMRDDPLTAHKDVCVGVIDVRPDTPVESVEDVVRRIETAISVLGGPRQEFLRRIWIKPDCGFRTLKDPVKSYAKMQAMMDAVERVRGTFGCP